MPRPRLLVTTPFHLRALLDSGVELPPVDMLLSATAPLSDDLAREAEARLGAPLHEIYGCTETGQLASRRTTDGAALAAAARRPARAGRTTSPSPAAATCEGRAGAGRRHRARTTTARSCCTAAMPTWSTSPASAPRSPTSTTSSTAIPGVEDGCFFMPDEPRPTDGITRLCAFVVAPDADADAAVAKRCAQRIDPIFLPRPLVLRRRLPRNATGKLPRAELQALLDRHARGAQP